MKEKKIYTQLIVLCAIFIVALQVFMVRAFPNHKGTDDQSVEIIQEIAPGYTPWVSNIWEPGSDNVEQLIFAIQIILGLSIIVFYLITQRKKLREDNASAGTI